MRLRFSRAVPAVLQAGGGVAALVGVYLLLGLPWALLTGGVALVVLATLKEAGLI